MKLTLQDVRMMTHGALDVREVDGQFIFTRFTDRQQAYYDEIKPDFGVKAHATSGVRLEFFTDAEKFSFDQCCDFRSGKSYIFHFYISPCNLFISLLTLCG